jgi:alkaline phosphatase D
MGDVAVQDRMNDQGLHRADYLLRDFIPAWQKLVATVPVYDTWDDHDYFNDDLAGIPEGFSEKDKENVWEVYRYAWNNPSYGFGDNGKGVFFRTRIGPADVIMVDDRYFRKGVKGSFLGREQLDWLKTNLAQCKGPFIILSCGTMWSDYVDEGKDSWGVNDPEGREELFNFIESKDISGVLLISGDRHGARGFTIPRPSGFSFYEFEVASLGGRVGPPVSKPEWKNQFYGISGKFAFGEFTFTGSKKDPEVVFRLIDDDGAIINETRLKKSQLTPSNFRNKVLISNEK